MAQELHVLKCFSCETFQSHIVKKSNKWECKVCGTKQSIKKVYGRGSGRDCRIHTQKLNSLKGEKDDQKHVANEEEREEDMERRAVLLDLQETAQSSNELPRHTMEPSKWKVFLDEDNSHEQRSNYTTQCYKRKRSVDKDDSDIGRGYDINFETCESVDDIYSDFSRTEIHLKQTKYSNNLNKIYKNYVNLESKSLGTFETENEPPMWKSITPVSNRVPSKVNFEWPKYIEQDNTENMHCPNTKNDKFDEVVRTIFNLKDRENKRVRKLTDHNYKLFNESNADELVLKKKQSLPAFEQSCKLVVNDIKRAGVCSGVKDCDFKVSNTGGKSTAGELVLAEDMSLPVFEQTGVLDESDFQLDF